MLKLKKLWKDLMLDAVFPAVYAVGALRPVRKDKVIFAEYQQEELPETFQEIYSCLDRATDYDLHYHTLLRLKASGPDYMLRCIRLVWDLSNAGYVFVREGMTVTGCLKIRKGTTVTQLWHACGAFKRFGLSTAQYTFGPDLEGHERHPMYRNYSYVTVSSPDVVWAYEEAMGLSGQTGVVLPLGLSRTDAYFRPSFRAKAEKQFYELFPEARGKKVILYAPTFRGAPDRPEAPALPDLAFLSTELGDSYVWVIKQHPSVAERPAIPSAASGFARDLSDDMPISLLMCVSDLCVTDYSSVIFEFSLMNRPMLFYAYDLEDYSDWRGFYYPFEEMTPGPVCRSTQELAERIRQAQDWFDPDQVETFRKTFMSSCDGHATERILKTVFPGDELKKHWTWVSRKQLRDHSLSDVQRRLLEMLKWFHAFCVDHDLTYFAVGGTMLGAVRHGGFIPWDDDLDIGMPRSDYERLSTLMQEECSSGRYRIETIYMEAPDYLVPHAKVFDTWTTLVERKKVPCRRGLYIDILPLDGTGQTYEDSLRHFAGIGLRLDVLAARVCSVRPERSFLKNAAIVAASLVPDFLYRENAQMQAIDRICSQIPYETSEYVADLYGIKRKKEIMKRSVFGTPKLYPFEDMLVYGVEDPEAYLTNLFGDWRKLPPKKEQVTHHDYEFCDLDHSYLAE